MRSAEDIWVSIQSRPHGHSGRGVSFYKGWLDSCGKRQHLNQQLVEEGIEPPRRTDARGFAYFDVGVYYHLLHEIDARGQMPEEAWDVESTLDVDFGEAMRLYHGWKRQFHSVAEKYGGVVLGVEMQFPSCETAKQVVQQTFGGELTGRADLVMQIDDPEAVRRNTQTEHSPGLTVERGVYLVDFKTSGKFSELDYLKYSHDLQARCYTTLYNLENKDRPAKGMIFDQIIKHTNFSRVPVYAGSKVKQHSSFHAYLQRADPNLDMDVLRTLVRNGNRNAMAPIANPSACIGQWDVCPHLTNGTCRGY